MGMFGFLKKKEGEPQEQVPSAPGMPPSFSQPDGLPNGLQGQASIDIPDVKLPDVKLPESQQSSLDIPPAPSFPGEPSVAHENAAVEPPAQSQSTENIDNFPIPLEHTDVSMSSMLDSVSKEEDQKPTVQQPAESETPDEPKETTDMPPIKPLDFDKLMAKKEPNTSGEDMLREDTLQEPELAQESTTPPGVADEVHDLWAAASSEKPAPEPMAEPTPEPMAEPTPELMAEPTPEPMAEPTPEPMEEPTPEPMEEPTPEPMEEPTPEPMEEPIQEPVSQQSPEMTYFDGQQQETEQQKEEPPQDDVSERFVSKRIINETMYINLDDFREVVDLMNSLSNETKMADETLLRVKDITLGKEKVYDKWQIDMELVERELIQLDKLLFKI